MPSLKKFRAREKERKPMGENSVTAKVVREPQGYNSKQGCGVSQNLGPAARLRALMHTQTARSPVATL